MAVIFDFYRDCDIMVDRSDTFDTILGPLILIQRSELQIATDYCINNIGREGVKHQGAIKGLSVFPGCVLTVGGMGSLQHDRAVDPCHVARQNRKMPCLRRHLLVLSLARRPRTSSFARHVPTRWQIQRDVRVRPFACPCHSADVNRRAAIGKWLKVNTKHKHDLSFFLFFLSLTFPLLMSIG
ncbi:hypothetical protein AB205_0070230 [Aquarana catesbeiana]|uniref:Uncharacterized protein n=1 Tax=Aquarana catesbeiana TaxID=8400 RepID=A0A2G9S916_AQUCT|nr:hypothetical protein AB205_0070230 [Aquarana catesbeiana]